jgi:hypothetical protein
VARRRAAGGSLRGASTELGGCRRSPRPRPACNAAHAAAPLSPCRPRRKPQFKGADAKKAEGLPDIMMLTTDVALLHDPAYLKHVKAFAANQTFLTEEFGKAW